jgi:lipopolysaccharide heptosyltransferase I
MHSAAADPERLLVVRLSALGDVIHTIPAAVALRRALPGTSIAWVVEKPYAELVERVAGLRAIPVSMKRWSRNLRDSRGEIRSAVGELRSFARAQASIDFQGLVKSAALAAISGARRRHGFDVYAIREKPALIFINERSAVRTDRHVIDWNFDLAAAVAPIERNPDVDFNPFVADATPALEALAGRVVLLPGAGKANKLWPSPHFAELARRLGPRALAVWGPGELDLARAIGCEVAPPTSLRVLAYLLRHASAVVGSDTGPLHLAAALHTPLVGLYGPTNPRRNGPWGQLDRCISHFDGDRQMETIGVNEVMAMVESVAR